MDQRISAYVVRTSFSDRIEIRLMAVGAEGRRAAALPVTFKELEEGKFVPPAVELQLSEAQRLMDELWGAGLRPTEGAGSAGAMAATQRHLEDMRSIAMGLLKGEL